MTEFVIFNDGSVAVRLWNGWKWLPWVDDLDVLVLNKLIAALQTAVVRYENKGRQK